MDEIVQSTRKRIKRKLMVFVCIKGFLGRGWGGERFFIKRSKIHYSTFFENEK